MAAETLGTEPEEDTVNAALREVGQRLVRGRALAGLGEMADRGEADLIDSYPGADGIKTGYTTTRARTATSKRTSHA
jgi:hypothetical protein